MRRDKCSDKDDNTYIHMRLKKNIILTAKQAVLDNDKEMKVALLNKYPNSNELNAILFPEVKCHVCNKLYNRNQVATFTDKVTKQQVKLCIGCEQDDIEKANNCKGCSVCQV